MADPIKTAGSRRAQLCDSLRRNARKPQNFVLRQPAVALYVAWYNMCRVHMTLRVTPAMEAGIADHIWSVGELLGEEA
jgi:hypothetical protein